MNAPARIKTVNMLEAKTHLSRLVHAVEKGEEVIISRNGKPVARLVPHVETTRRPSLIGIAKGRFVIPDDIDGSNDEIAKMFYGDDWNEKAWRRSSPRPAR